MRSLIAGNDNAFPLPVKQLFLMFSLGDPNFWPAAELKAVAFGFFYR
jgi:hypothetical protein